MLRWAELLGPLGPLSLMYRPSRYHYNGPYYWPISIINFSEQPALVEEEEEKKGRARAAVSWSLAFTSPRAIWSFEFDFGFGIDRSSSRAVDRSWVSSSEIGRLPQVIFLLINFVIWFCCFWWADDRWYSMWLLLMEACLFRPYLSFFFFFFLGVWLCMICEIRPARRAVCGRRNVCRRVRSPVWQGFNCCCTASLILNEERSFVR